MDVKTDETSRPAHGPGPWPFIGFRNYFSGRHHIVLRARWHRKGLIRHALEAGLLPEGAMPFWQTRSYNWSVGALFAFGSTLFMLGSALALVPAGPLAPSALAVNSLYFMGSIPFTMAGYLQHLQSANMTHLAPEPEGGAPPRHHLSLIGWEPGNAGWLSTFTQFLGTLAFNISTWNGVMAPQGWLVQDLLIWTPDMAGSILFLISGYLAFLETCGRYWSWKPQELDWQIVFINLLGCVAFMISAVLSYVPDGPQGGGVVMGANITLLLGALCFCIGGVLTSYESEAAAPG
ncbi:hypothetical protein ACT6QH_07395 [Xanthobacter sp. TB0139]|uniref:hypothetical protein n=1 Tax=Xanthobacter sp. TB0139 TaxID=3459178 RepID=UPI0040393346